MNDDRPDTVTTALALAKLNFHVFDVDHPDLPKCVGIRTRDHDPDSCVERGKHPACKWSVEATTDPERITAMFAGRTRNIGIACGKSRVFVVDEDAEGELGRYCESVGQAVPDTFRVKTGKGWHYYFRAVDGLELGNAEGDLKPYEINVRGVGGYVVGPGSVHETGHVYVVGEVGFKPVLPLPQFLIKALTPPKAKDDPFAQPATSPADETGRIPENKRHETLMRYAASLRARNVRPHEAEILMRKCWERCVQPPAAKVERTWEHALVTLRDVYRRYKPGEAPTANGEAAGRTVRLTPASAIKPRPVHWLWQGRIPAGEFTITPGRGGLGKSTFHVRTAADITNGTLPGVWFGTPKPVIIAAVEDSWSRTIVPRLMAAGANMDLVFRADVVTEVEDEEYTLTLPRDIAALEKEITRIGAVMLSVDPLLSAINGLDSHKDAEVRQALQPLARMADRTDCAVLGNAHFNKSSGSDPLALVMGSAAFGNVARAALGFARDTEAEDDSCVISQVKNNLGRLDLPSLRYRIEGVFLETPEGPAEIGHLVWLGESERSVADILRDRFGSEARTERDEAKDFLRALLPAPAKDVQGEAKNAGLSWPTVRRAAEDLGVRKIKQGKPGEKGQHWLWTLTPVGAHEESEDAQSSDGEHLGHLREHLGESATACRECGQQLMHPESIALGLCANHRDAA